MKNIFNTIIILSLLAVIACKPTSNEDSNNTKVEAAHKNQVYTVGRYKTVLPCDDCEGIEMTVVLKEGNTYELTEKYIGKSIEPIVKQGTFTWKDTTNIMSLSGEGEKAIDYQFRVLDNYIQKLDGDGFPIQGDHAPKYFLNIVPETPKEADGSTPVSIYWALESFNGKPISVGAGEKSIYFALQLDKHRVSGNSGCNSFSGDLTIKENGIMEWTKLLSTKKACPDMSLETSFLAFVADPLSYKEVDGKMTLQNTKTNTLATFTAVPQ